MWIAMNSKDSVRSGNIPVFPVIFPSDGVKEQDLGGLLYNKVGFF